jgi:hypothetical protein
MLLPHDSDMINKVKIILNKILHIKSFKNVNLKI